MGIQGLLPLLKSIHKATHLRDFAGQTLGVDAYGWLHRGTIACAVELAEGTPTRKHIDYALNRVRMLIHFGVKPYIVFDGDYLPSKTHTEKERAARRKESKKTGLDLLRMGRRSQAHLELQKAIDVTPTMAREFIDELKRLDVPYIVAPYEADSQLAYLEKQGTISGVISEDSDLLVFGVQCLLTKLDQYGECVMIKRSDFTSCREISLVGWSDKEFRMMAMLSGCDYLPGIGKMGLKTAYQLVRKHKTIERVVRSVQFDGKMRVPAGYLEDFYRAEQTFLHQWVFSPTESCLVHLSPLPPKVEASSMPFIGRHVDATTAAGVACGQLDPNTKRLISVPPRFYQNAARHQIMQTPNEKSGKPISEFFKPRRVPLAELDPNSFTPSPSQQRLLEAQETRSWSASRISAHRAATGIAHANSVPLPLSAPPASRRTMTDPSPPLMGRASPKRQRLCSDYSITSAMGGTQDLRTAASHFFGKQPTQTSPSLRKKSKKKEEFDLWSDDSVAEAVAAATATPESTQEFAKSSSQSKKKLTIFADTPASQDDSQTTIATTTTDTSRSSIAIGTPDTSIECLQSPIEETVFNSSSLAALRSRAYNPTPKKPGLRTKSAPAVAPTPTKRDPKAADINQRASASPQKEDFVPTSSPIQNVSPVIGPANDEDSIEDEEWLAVERRTATRYSDIGILGSEDLLVPESPEKSEEESSSRPKLDLSRFTFGAR